METHEEKIIEILRNVIDPELMVNVVDLGLVYGVTYDESNQWIDVDLTLTSPGCPMGGMIMEDAQMSIETKYPDFRVKINLVWEPEWSPEKLTEEGKAALGYY
jgi:metal-sulfur cluster biosynthetic enzyme